MNKIPASCSSLADLIEAYSVLTARLRAVVQESTDSDCSWPLFQPLRKRCPAFADAVVRDLGHALVDPIEGSDRSDWPVTEPPSVLSSPEKNPRKRCGMNEEQVKYARDLATVSHAVIKLPSLVFTLPAVYSLFDGSCHQLSFSFFFPVDLARFVDQDLGSVVTQALSIPLAPELPTPNARKTCAPSGSCRRSDCPQTFSHQLRTELRMLFDAPSRANLERRARRDR